MAEIPKINDIASQLSTASRLVVSTDFFWVYMGDGTQVKIPAEFIRAYLTNGITPVIDENGNWIIGDKETGVKAEGVTPMLRSNGTLGIEVSYDKGKTWQMVVLYSDLDPDIQSLVDAYNAIVQSEQGRVNAEIDRQNAWAAWFENATTGVEALWNTWFSATKKAWSDWFGATESAGVRKIWSDWFTSIKSEWSTLNTSASNAESARVSAETSRANAESSRVSGETSRVNAENARVSAESARDSSETTRKSNESTRISNENTRIANENARVSQESTRQSNETTRQSAWTVFFSACKNEWNELKSSINHAVNTLLNDLDTKRDYIGEDGYWMHYDYETDTFVKTTKYALGGIDWPKFDVDTDTMNVKVTIGETAEEKFYVNDDGILCVRV